MKYYAVIDTNVILSALLSKKADSATVKVLDAVFDGTIIPLFHQDILAEYSEVLSKRQKTKYKNIFSSFYIKTDDRRFLLPAAICFSHPLLFYCLKCLVKILNDIVNIFRSDGQADRIRPDSLI